MSNKILFSTVARQFAAYINYASSSFPVHHREDIVQEGYLGLYRAYESFNETKDVPFDAFAKICIKRQMVYAYKILCKDDNALIFDEEAFETIPAEESDTEDIKDFFNRLRCDLTNLEKSVLNEYLKDLSYEQIANRLRITQKQVDNTLTRIKRKIKNKYTF